MDSESQGGKSARNASLNAWTYDGRNPNNEIRAATSRRRGDTLFYILALLTLVFGFLVIANPFSRNPVTSAMFLVLTLGSLAGLFVLLHAFFLAAVQVLVYAGAVMV